MSYHPGKFTWFEHLSSDPARARQFYEALFGWKVETMQGADRVYEMITNRGEGIAGFLQAPPGVPNRWLSHLSVGDVDASYNAALAAGARSLMAPGDFGDVGRGAAVADPTGAALSLWKATQGDREDRAQVPMGDWVWNELYTPDVDKSLAFYQGVFGFTHDIMDMGPQGQYFIIKSADGTARGGIMKSPDADTPPMWMPYVRVEQADATAARIGPLGGKLMMAPHDVPQVGRICALFDPLGAPVAFIQTAVM